MSNDNEEIIVEINEKGFVKIQAHGLSGPACIDTVTKMLKDIAVVTEINKTDEFYGQSGVKTQTESNIESKGGF